MLGSHREAGVTASPRTAGLRPQLAWSWPQGQCHRRVPTAQEQSMAATWALLSPCGLWVLPVWTWHLADPNLTDLGWGRRLGTLSCSLPGACVCLSSLSLRTVPRLAFCSCESCHPCHLSSPVTGGQLSGSALDPRSPRVGPWLTPRAPALSVCLGARAGGRGAGGLTGPCVPRPERGAVVAPPAGAPARLR